MHTERYTPSRTNTATAYRKDRIRTMAKTRAETKAEIMGGIMGGVTGASMSAGREQEYLGEIERQKRLVSQWAGTASLALEALRIACSSLISVELATEFSSVALTDESIQAEVSGHIKQAECNLIGTPQENAQDAEYTWSAVSTEAVRNGNA